MIALLIAFAPIASPYFGNCTGTDAALFARECPSQHCEHADCRDELERARYIEPHFRADPPPKETFHLDCDPNAWANKDCEELLSRWSAHCYGVIQCTDEPSESYCIWRSDGTVEAKNATCSDRKGERQ